MKFYFTGLFLLLIWCSGVSQSQLIVGQILDSSGKPLELATVMLLNSKDSTFLKGAVSDEKGKYELLGVKSGNYFIKANSVGLQEFVTKSFIFDENMGKTVEQIKLNENSQELKSVTVVAKKPLFEIRADKTIMNIEGSINATGNTALELLQKAPGVMIDKDENVTLKGKNGVRIYIDGKPSVLDGKDLANYLKGIQSTDIEAIELITNPSAKYDASGNAGIINLRLKKNKNFGVNGNIGIWNDYGITPKGGTWGNINYRNKSINIFGNGSYNLGKNQNNFLLYRRQSGKIFDQNNVNINDATRGGYKAGADYFLNSKNTIGVVLDGNFSKGTSISNSRTRIANEATSGVVDSVLIATNDNPNSRANLNLNLNYRYTDTSGHELNIDIDRGMFRNRANSYQPNFYKTSDEKTIFSSRIFRNSTPTDIQISTLKADYEQSLWKGKFGVGFKIATVTTDNIFDFFNVQTDDTNIKDLEKSNRFKYTENVNAAYLNYNAQVGKFGIQTGVRMENTRSKGELIRVNPKKDDIVERQYTNFFPSAAVTYNVNKNNSLGLTYSRRIDRPSYQDLNPFENKLDELTYEKGNAFLQPQYSHNFELNHTFMQGLITGLSYSRTNDLFTQIIDTTERYRTFVTQKNVAKQDNYAISISAPLPLAKWYNGFLNLSLYHSKFKADFGNNYIIDTKITSYNAYMQNSFLLGSGWSAELSGWYNGPSIWGGVFRSKQQGSVDVGVQKRILNDRGTIKVAVDDIFFTTPWRGISDASSGFYIDTKGNWESRRLKINFTYRFGGNDVKGARERKTGLDDENRRIKSGK